ncbi:MAG: type I-E CRISPR-associated protein Cas6/Cse3/CasE [Planctomycetia bacterium]|nr:type I-E CRISPR-associated protein Cas6/Cse3/CasE [Planctomycetia bacterium]
MYLTRLILTLEDFRRENITDDYSIHRVVYSLFKKEEQNRILYFDRGGKGNAHVMLILSPVRPALDTLFQLETKEIPADFWRNRHFHFEIVLNPVRTQSVLDTKLNKMVKKRIPIRNKDRKIEREMLYDWFREQAEKHGFMPWWDNLEFQVLHSQCVPKGGVIGDVRYHRVKFTGTLTVTDEKLFRETFENGLGKGKAFGCGMFLLMPALG